jgi:hypothetical protein
MNLYSALQWKSVVRIYLDFSNRTIPSSFWFSIRKCLTNSADSLIDRSSISLYRSITIVLVSIIKYSFDCSKKLFLSFYSHRKLKIVRYDFNYDNYHLIWSWINFHASTILSNTSQVKILHQKLGRVIQPYVPTL